MLSNSSGNTWFAVSMGLVGLIVGYGLAIATQSGGQALLGSQPAAPNPSAQVAQPSAPEAQDVPAVTAEDHVRGNPDALISVIEYSDFECPFCKRHHPTLVQLLEDNGDEVNWVYRHFPLGFHPNAEPGAIASECVNEIGGNDAFWDFTDLVFENQGEWDYEKYVEEIGLNVRAFQNCLNDNDYAAEIQAEMAAGSAAGVRGTPGNIVLNNETGESRLVSGAQALVSFTNVIEEIR